MAEFNVKNRTILLGDNLPHLRGINSESVDLVYLDPPFNKETEFISYEDGRTVDFEDSFSVEKHGPAIVEELRAVGRENEVLCDWLTNVENIDQDKKKSNYAYLVFMSVRLLECHRILKPTGSLLLHCDDTMNAWLRITLGIIFGTKNFRNEICWKRTTGRGNATRKFPRLKDTIFWYSKNHNCKFLPQFKDFSAEYIREHYKHKEPETGRLYQAAPLTVAGNSNTFEFLGVTRNWMWKEEKMKEHLAKGLILQTKPGHSVPRLKKYLDEAKGVMVSDIWDDIAPVGRGEEGERSENSSTKKVRYRTRKPKKLMLRIIEAMTDKKGIVVDPFCGCATTCVAADYLGRHWVGIDKSHVAYEKIMERLPDLGREIQCETEPPVRDPGDTGFGSKHVYVMSCVSYPDWYKVGVAVDAKARLKSYLISSPFRADAFRMEYVSMKTSFYREAEKHIHDKFQANGEWIENVSAKALTNEIKRFLKDKQSPATRIYKPPS